MASEGAEPKSAPSHKFGRCKPIIAANERSPMKNLESLMTEHANVSLAKLAEATEAPYAAVRAKAKQPIEGVAYDPNATNWTAIEQYLLKRNPELKLEELPWEDINTKTERATKTLKDNAIDFSVGQTYWLRYFKQNWTIVYSTETHVCLMVADGSSTQPKVMAKSTMVACGIKPAQVAENEEGA